MGSFDWPVHGMIDHPEEDDKRTVRHRTQHHPKSPILPKLERALEYFLLSSKSLEEIGDGVTLQ